MKILISSVEYNENILQKHYPILKKYNIDEDNCIELKNLEELKLLQNDLEQKELIIKSIIWNDLPYQLEIEIYDGWRE
jgi:hypothetical protein